MRHRHNEFWSYAGRAAGLGDVEGRLPPDRRVGPRDLSRKKRWRDRAREAGASTLGLEDSQATILVAEEGYSKRRRHLPQTQRISLVWLSQVIGSPDCMLLYARSEFQVADIFAKSSSSGDKFGFVRGLVGVNASWHGIVREPTPQPPVARFGGAAAPPVYIAFLGAMPAPAARADRKAQPEAEAMRKLPASTATPRRDRLVDQAVRRSVATARQGCGEVARSSMSSMCLWTAACARRDRDLPQRPVIWRRSPSSRKKISSSSGGSKGPCLASRLDRRFVDDPEAPKVWRTRRLPLRPQRRVGQACAESIRLQE